MVQMCKLPLAFGSAASIELHQELKKLGESEHFRSKTIQRYLEFKWTEIRQLGYYLSALYVAYLLSLMFIPHWFVLSIWLIIHMLIEGY